MESSSRCVFNEGSLAVPYGFQEQTINIFAAENRPSLNLSRDTLNSDETFADYLARQRDVLKKGLTAYQELACEPCYLGDRLVEGISLLSHYRQKNGRLLYQRQAVFLVSSLRVLILTQASSAPLTEEDTALFECCLASYQAPAETA